MGAMVVAIGFRLFSNDMVTTPPLVRFLAFAAIGWILGQQVTVESLAETRAALVPIVIVVVGLMGAGLVAALILRAMGLDIVTAVLASSPGGISQMSSLAIDLGGNPALVVAAHVIRLAAVVIFTPILVWVLSHP